MSLTRALILIIGLVFALPSYAKEPPSSFADLSEKLLPTVVTVSTTQSHGEKGKGFEVPQFPPGSPFEEFFKDFFDRQQRSEQGKPKKEMSVGSGFIIDAEGYIVTNNHVVADAEEITVILNDDTALKATVVGKDPKTDLALLKVQPKSPLSVAKWGNSDEVRIGDWILAIGNPFGLGGTVTAGIISARARDINSGPYDDFLQTDASINRGNSGGPMFNIKGEVIGINTAIYSPSGGSVGIGFAIPSTMAKAVLDDLRKHGRTRRGWLGVRIQSVNEEIAESLGLKETGGALIAGVNEKGPAEKAGIKAGDVVLKFDGKKISEMRRLPRMVAETPIGKEVDVVLWRDGKSTALKVTIGELEEKEEQASVPGAPNKKGSQNKAATHKKIATLGIAVADITPELRDKYDIPDTAKGVVVVEVDPNGSASEKGIRPGNLILEATQTVVNSAAELISKVEEAKENGRKSVLLLVDSPQAGMRYVAIKLEEKEKKKEKK